MNETDLKNFENKLLQEKTKLEGELSTVGHVNPDNPADWETTLDTEGREADPNVKADGFEDFENRKAILTQLEVQLGDVNLALEKIKTGNYGTCEVSGEEIEIERLEANPAARTCMEHMNE